MNYRKGANRYIKNVASGGVGLGRRILYAGKRTLSNPSTRRIVSNVLGDMIQRATAAPRKTYRRRAVRSRYVGRFKGKMRKPKRGAARVTGAVTKVEGGGSVSDPDVVFVGHGTFPVDNVILTVFLALVRKLFAAAGCYITNWEEVTPYAGTVTITYYSDPADTTPGVLVHVYTAGSKYRDIAIGLKTQYYALASGSQCILSKMEMGSTGGDTVKVYLNQCYLNIRLASELTIQNRTVSDSTGSDTTSSLNVSNNPIYGRSYYGKGTAFIPTLLTSTSQPFAIDKSYGNFKNTATESAFSTTRKPPDASYFSGCKLVKNVMVQPGEMKKDKLYSSHSMTLNEFMNLVYDEGEFTTGRLSSLGKIQMFAFEKMLNTRDADEPSVNVGYESNITIC